MFDMIMCIKYGVDILHQPANHGQIAEDIGKINKLRKLCYMCVYVCMHAVRTFGTLNDEE